MAALGSLPKLVQTTALVDFDRSIDETSVDVMLLKPYGLRLELVGLAMREDACIANRLAYWRRPVAHNAYSVVLVSPVGADNTSERLMAALQAPAAKDSRGHAQLSRYFTN